MKAIPKSKAKNAYQLLGEIRKLIIAEPKRYVQHIWLDKRQRAGVRKDFYPACGTVACVAGWVTTLKQPEVIDPADIRERAADILGVDCRDLFSGGALITDAAPQSVDYARAGAAHIAAFQNVNRAQLLAKKV